MIIDDIFSARTVAISDLRNPDLWLTNALGGTQTQSGERVDFDKALTLSAYWACLHNISEDCAKLPLITYQRLPAGGKERKPEHRIYPLLHDSPHPNMTSIAFRETMFQYALGWGNGYAKIHRNNIDQIVGLSPMHPGEVRPETDEETGEVFYMVRVKGEEEVFFQREVFDLHGVGGNGIQGHSVLQYGAEAIGSGLAKQKMSASYYGNSAQPLGVLQHPGKMGDKALEHLRKSWKERYGGDNMLSPAILEEGMEWKGISINPVDALLIDSEHFTVEDIARFFRMPPHKIQHLLRATYSNIESQSIEYVGDTLQPWFVRFEQECSRKLFADDNKHFAEHLVDGMLRGDQAARSTFYREQFNIGALNQNEIRALENRNPIPGGDIYYVPMNMVRSQDAASGKPTEPPEPKPDTNEPPGPPDANNPATLDRFKNAQMVVFRDVASRALRREAKAAARAALKHTGDDAGFDNWASRFYDDQRAMIEELFSAPAEALFQALGGAGNVESDVHRFAVEQSDLSRKYIIAAVKEGRIEERLVEWAELRPEAMARQIMHKITESLSNGNQ
jgi:HK97 family phage portal protein